MKIILNAALLLTLALGLSRCTDTTVIGGDLLEGAELPVTYTDALPLDFSVVPADPPAAPPAASVRLRGVLPLGCFTDPVYGEVSSKIGVELVELDSVFNLVGNAIDSVFLVLPLDPVQQVGDTAASVSIRVSAAAPNTLRTLNGLTTSDDFEATDRVYAEATFVPRRDSVLVNEFSNGALRVITTSPQVRIPLNAAYGEDLIAALEVIIGLDTLASDSAFLSNLPGLVIEPTACGNTAAALRISNGLSAPNNAGVSILQPNYFGVQVYFRGADNKTQTRNLRPFRSSRNTIARVRLASTRNLEGTYANELANGAGDADTLTLVEAFDGSITRIDLTDISSLSSNVVVSYAALQLPIAERGGEGPLPFLEAVRNDGDTSLTRVSPLSRTNISAAQSAQILSFDGGFVQSIPDPAGGGTDSVPGYQLNLTGFMQRVANGEVEPTLYVRPLAGTDEMPASSLILGPEATGGARARLIVATTRLP